MKLKTPNGAIVLASLMKNTVFRVNHALFMELITGTVLIYYYHQGNTVQWGKKSFCMISKPILFRSVCLSLTRLLISAILYPI